MTEIVERLERQAINVENDGHVSAARAMRDAATALTEARAEIERLRKVACDCATAIGNGAALSPESSLDFIELLPGEIAKHTDKLRRFLKCARDEGTEALDRAAAAESELSTLRARVREVVGPFGNLTQRYDDTVSDGWISWVEFVADHAWPTETNCRAARQLNEDLK